MSLRYNQKHLREMLSRSDLNRDDKQAIRFALRCISQLYVKQSPAPTMPYWRSIEDGIYQCLNCKEQWESVTRPQKFCQFCGQEFEGPIKELTGDNPRMLGERRLKQHNAMFGYRKPRPSFWWSICVGASEFLKINGETTPAHVVHKVVTDYRNSGIACNVKIRRNNGTA